MARGRFPGPLHDTHHVGILEYVQPPPGPIGPCRLDRAPASALSPWWSACGAFSAPLLSCPGVGPLGSLSRVHLAPGLALMANLSPHDGEDRKGTIPTKTVSSGHIIRRPCKFIATMIIRHARRRTELQQCNPLSWPIWNLATLLDAWRLPGRPSTWRVPLKGRSPHHLLVLTPHTCGLWRELG